MKISAGEEDLHGQGHIWRDEPVQEAKVSGGK